MLVFLTAHVFVFVVSHAFSRIFCGFLSARTRSLVHVSERKQTYNNADARFHSSRALAVRSLPATPRLPHWDRYLAAGSRARTLLLLRSAFAHLLVFVLDALASLVALTSFSHSSGSGSDHTLPRSSRLRLYVHCALVHRLLHSFQESSFCTLWISLRIVASLFARLRLHLIRITQDLDHPLSRSSFVLFRISFSSPLRLRFTSALSFCASCWIVITRIVLRCISLSPRARVAVSFSSLDHSTSFSFADPRSFLSLRFRFRFRSSQVFSVVFLLGSRFHRGRSHSRLRSHAVVHTSLLTHWMRISALRFFALCVRMDHCLPGHGCVPLSGYHSFSWITLTLYSFLLHFMDRTFLSTDLFAGSSHRSFAHVRVLVLDVLLVWFVRIWISFLADLAQFVLVRIVFVLVLPLPLHLRTHTHASYTHTHTRFLLGSLTHALARFLPGLSSFAGSRSRSRIYGWLSKWFINVLSFYSRTPQSSGSHARTRSSRTSFTHSRVRTFSLLASGSTPRLPGLRAVRTAHLASLHSYAHSLHSFCTSFSASARILAVMDGWIAYLASLMDRSPRFADHSHSGSRSGS